MTMCSLLLCCWKRVFAMTSAFSWQNSVNLCPALFCAPRPNFTFTPMSSSIEFQFPMVKRTSRFGFSSRRSCKSSQNRSVSASSALVLRGVDLDYCDAEWFALETNRDHSVIFETESKYCILDSFVDCDGYSISSKEFLPRVVDIMVI